MVRTSSILIAILLIGVLLIACGDETPTAPVDTGGGTNHTPAAPTIDTGRGAPADGATGSSTASQLYWNCTDPDGDALEYDVFFGTGSDPAGVATGQTTTSYNPGALANNTTYRWKIVAKDPGGMSASSPVWSFTTAAVVTEIVSAPGSVAGEATRPTGTDGSYSVVGASTSTLGHTVQYQFDWGDGSDSGWLATESSSHAWSSAGAYEVKARARCATHTTIGSDWSPSMTVTVADAAETVSAPGAVTGPATAETYQNTTCSVSTAATSSLGHAVQYRYDWGDGTLSIWNPNMNASHAWSAAGIYEVRAQARCATHPTVESSWTGALTVSVTDQSESVSRPTITSGPSTGGVGEDLIYFSNYATNSAGHAVEHRYDWGDGSMSAWAASQIGTHGWASEGTYEIKSQARCAIHTTVESSWSDPVTVSITSVEIISVPTITPETEFTVTKNTAQTITLLASSNFGHALQYTVEWGDGEIRDWSSQRFPSHAWSALGDYNVRVKARCSLHTSIESEWSAFTVAHVVESVSTPTVSGPPSGSVGVPVTFTASGAASSEGHALEYRLWTSRYYYQGWEQQQWTTIDNLTHTFDSAWTWYVRVQARCIEHQTESVPSGYIPISVSN